MKLQDKQEVDFDDALWNSQCNKCSEILQWGFEPDADGSHYFAQCCGLAYRMNFPKGMIEIFEIRE